MKVLTVAPYWFPDGGGLERYAREVAQGLVRRGHEVHAVALGREARAFEDGGVRVEVLPFHARASNTPIRIDLAPRLARALRRGGFDVVHAHTPVPYAAEMAGLASAATGVPLVATYHAGARTRVPLERAMLARASRLLAVTPFVAERALRPWRRKTTVATPGVHPPADVAPPPAARRVLFVGPVDSRYRWKGLDVLLDALARLPRARLDVAGTGDRVGEVLARATRERLDVRVHGRVDDATLAALYRAADVVALPSTGDAESFGMVLAEAQAHGRPVVAGGGGTVHAFRDGVTGLAARPGDAGDLADALASLLDEPAHAAAMGRRAREFAVKEFDWERTVDATERALAVAAHADVPAARPFELARAGRVA